MLKWPSEQAGKVCKKPTKLVTHPKTQNWAFGFSFIANFVGRKSVDMSEDHLRSEARVEKQRKTEGAAHTLEW